MPQQPLPGVTISPDELLDRWSYSELRSSRNGHQRAAEFGLTAADSLVVAAKRGDPFHLLLPFDLQRLRGMRSMQMSGLQAPVTQMTRFTCESWTKERVGTSWVVPALDPRRFERPPQAVPFVTMLAAPLAINPSTNSTESSDPRVAAANVPLNQPLGDIEPLIVVPFLVGPRAVPLLLDGTTRSVLFVRSEDSLAEVLVWVGGR
jgi:hypothetical protein